MTTDIDIQEVLDLERELQTTSTRGDEPRLRELLAPDFIEIGASGRRWDRGSVLQLLAQQADDQNDPAIQVHDLQARVVDNDLVQVFWDSDQAGRRARRTSLWRRTGRGWCQIYHQGTLLPGPS